MTDETETRPMDDARSEHPDEGTIHAWLDGALDEPTASRIAAHVGTCGACDERVAEARGLIAG
ncbi:MAG: zf-HC2 domain-containing protein, partial [Gemmatimonadaceae bacterium]